LKKITAIFFLVLFSFNWFGYRLYYDYLQHKTNENLEALFDSNTYDESQLIELKIAIHLPYQTSWTTYQRYDGEIKLNGTTYKYVKRKLLNDTLYLKCIPNKKVMALQNAKEDFFKITNDLNQNNHPQKADNSNSVFKNITVFDGSCFGANIVSPLHECQQWLPLKSEDLQSLIQLSPEQPPDYNA